MKKGQAPLTAPAENRSRDRRSGCAPRPWSWPIRSIPSERSEWPPRVRARRTASWASSSETAKSESRSPAESSVTATNVPSDRWATVVVQPFSWMAFQVTRRRDAIPRPLQLVSGVAAAARPRWCRICSVYRPLARKRQADGPKKSPIFGARLRLLGQEIGHRPMNGRGPVRLPTLPRRVYSQRNARTTSIREARKAGIRVATAADTSRMATAAPNTRGSSASRPNSWLWT